MRTALLVGVVLLATVAAGAGPALAAGPDVTHVASAQTDDCTFPVTTTDATGTEVTIAEEPETVVTLGPSAAQTMWEIGAKETVVGVSKYADYLEGAEDRPNVSGAGRSFVVTEKVVELDPDLVLAPNVITNDTVEKLRSAGLTVYRFEGAKSLSDVEKKVLLTGQLTGTCDGADQRVTEMNESLSTVEAAVDGTDRPRVLYYMGGGYTAGEGTFIDAIIETAGGTNVAAEAGIEGWRQINEEVVVSQNPEWILKSSDIASIPQTAAYNGTAAVQNDQILVLNADYVSQPAPRTVQVVERLASSFHPDAYAAANTTATTTEPPATTTTAGEQQTADETTQVTTATAPGMGVPVALVAVALVALSLREE